MRLLVALISCFLSACSVAQSSFEIAGHHLCVPKGHIIDKVAWIKPDGRAVRDSGGVAINNCLIVRAADRAFIKSACLFQPELESVAIDNDDGFRVRMTGAGARDTLLGRVASGEDTLRTRADHGRLLVLENQRLWNEWFVIRRRDARQVKADEFISDDDELVMMCRKSKSRIGATGGEFRVFFECKRDFIATGLSISYSFESESKVPSLDDVTKMDKSLMDGVGKLKCN